MTHLVFSLSKFVRLSILLTLRLCESQDEILFKGVVLSHPKNSDFSDNYYHFSPELGSSNEKF